MSEKIYACLLRLYPPRFRQAYGLDALQLFRDRLGDETGLVRRLRLWIDLLADLIVSLPRQYVSAEPTLVSETCGRSAGAPLFFVLEEKLVRPAALLTGCVLSIAGLSLTITLLNQAGRLHGMNFAFRASDFSTVDRWRTPGTLDAGSVLAAEGAAVYAPGSVTTTETLFPPPIDYLTLTNVKANPNVQYVFVYGRSDSSAETRLFAAQVANVRATAVVTKCAAGCPLDTERQRVLDGVITNLKQHYFDAAVAQQVGDALLEHQRNGDDAPFTDGRNFAAVLTAQMRDVSHDMHLEVVYDEAPPARPDPEELARTLAALQEDHCSFKKVQVLPRNIGYLKLDAFADPSACRTTALAAMASLNNADAVIFDLRDNRGGTAEMVSLISSYLFDHPEYLFDPRRVPTPQSWTASPVPDSKLANKPIFILTSSTTISAAEQFTYNLKMLKRATIVGETTAGAAHAGVWHRIDDRFAMAIPENRAVNPYARSDWEGTGIEPDIAVPASGALQTALARAQSQMHKK